MKKALNVSKWLYLSVFERLIASVLSVLLVLAALAGGEALSFEEGEAGLLLREIEGTQEIGDFEGAWRAWMDFLAHPGRNEPNIDDFSACFLKHGCPRPGGLGAMLGKSRDEARNLASFCPDWARPGDSIAVCGCEFCALVI